MQDKLSNVFLKNTNNRVIEDVKTEFPGFWNLNIAKSNILYKKTFFDEINASLLFERIAESGERDDLALVVPDDPTVVPMIIIEGLLCLLKFDSLDSPSNFLDGLAVGDNVFVFPFSGGRTMKPGIFDGIELKNGVKGYRVKDPAVSTNITWYPENTKWRIKPYTSQISEKRKGSSTAAGQELEELMNLTPGDLFGIQSSKGIVVTSNKGKLKDEIKEITVGGDPIESIFPIADFVDADTPRSLLADPLRREYLLGLVSNSDTAVDICFNDPSYKLVIIEGASKVRASYGNITRLNADKTARKVICILRPSDEDEINTLKSMDIDCWVWKKTDFQNAGIEKMLTGEVDSDFSLHDKVVSFISQSSQNIHPVNNSQIEDSIERFSSSLRNLYEHTPPSDDGGIMIRRFYSFLKFFSQIPISIRDYERYCFSKDIQLFLEKISNFERDVNFSFGVVFPKDVQKYANNAIAEIKLLYRLLENSSPKKIKLHELLSSKPYKDTTIVCSRPDVAEIIRTDNSIANDIKVVTLNELRIEPKSRVIFTGFFNRKFQSRMFLAPFIQNDFIFYKQELRWYRNLTKLHPASPDSTIDSGLRKQYFPELEQDIKPTPSNDYKSEDELSNILDAVNSKFGVKADISSAYSSTFVPSDELISANRIVFDDNSFTFIDENHRLTKIDRMAGEVLHVRSNQISIDDEIVFTDNSRNLFEDLLKDIKATGKYSQLENKASIWWRALKSYALNNHLNADDISSQLELKGCKRHPLTVREWMKGERIRPGKIDETMPAIAKITRNAELQENMVDIMSACKELHSIHIQVGRLLVKRIVSSVLDEVEDTELDEETKQKVESYAQRAQIKIVSTVMEHKEAVPSNSLGELFTLGDSV